ncbi:hypothetical protein WA158_003135 [Blastocystis sp. Blastoise]
MGTSESKINQKSQITAQSRSGAAADLPRIFSEPYLMDQKSIGEGRFGTVRSGIDISSDRKIAVKCVSKKCSQETKTLYNEKKYLEQLCHPNIVKYYDFFTTSKETCLVIEKCEGGELFELLQSQDKPFTETQTCYYLIQILQALEYIHKKHIAHRDLKLENCMLRDKDHNVVKIIDFGMATTVTEPLTEKVGTVSYMSPDILRGYYTEKTDMWSVGIMMYIMLSGDFPFKGKTDNETYEFISKGQINMDSDIWVHISSGCKHLLKRFLDMNPTTRISAEDALKHSWVLTTMKQESCLPWKSVLYGLDKFTKYNLLKQIVLEQMSILLAGAAIDKMSNTFDIISETIDGKKVVTAKGIQNLCYLQNENIPLERIETALNSIQEQLGRDITKSVCIGSSLRRSEYMKEAHLYSIFVSLDQDKDGNISKQDLKTVLPDEKSISTIFIDVNQISQSQLLCFHQQNTISFDIYRKLISTHTYKEKPIHTVKSFIYYPSPHEESISDPPTTSSTSPQQDHLYNNMNNNTNNTTMDPYHFASPAVEACISTPVEEYDDEIVFM